MKTEKYNIVEMDKLPLCDFCEKAGIPIEAYVDGKTIDGPWASMCRYCYSNMGIGLGLGKGQILKRRDSNE